MFEDKEIRCRLPQGWDNTVNKRVFDESCHNSHKNPVCNLRKMRDRPHKLIVDAGLDIRISLNIASEEKSSASLVASIIWDGIMSECGWMDDNRNIDAYATNR